jgi:hypothetical protein
VDTLAFKTRFQRRCIGKIEPNLKKPSVIRRPRWAFHCPVASRVLAKGHRLRATGKLGRS